MVFCRNFDWLSRTTFTIFQKNPWLLTIFLNFVTVTILFVLSEPTFFKISHFFSDFFLDRFFLVWESLFHKSNSQLFSLFFLPKSLFFPRITIFSLKKHYFFTIFCLGIWKKIVIFGKIHHFWEEKTLFFSQITIFFPEKIVISPKNSEFWQQNSGFWQKIVNYSKFWQKTCEFQINSIFFCQNSPVAPRNVNGISCKTFQYGEILCTTGVVLCSTKQYFVVLDYWSSSF